MLLRYAQPLALGVLGIYCLFLEAAYHRCQAVVQQPCPQTRTVEPCVAAKGIDNANDLRLELAQLRGELKAAREELESRSTTTEKVKQQQDATLPGKAIGLPGSRDPCHPASYYKPRTGSALNPHYLREAHHFSYGRPWAMGREVFEHLASWGNVLPGQKVLDFGMGSLRLGIHLIPYLAKEGSYCGIEPDPFSFHAAQDYEVPLHGLERFQPTLVHSSDRTPHVEDCGLGPGGLDKIVAYSVLQHLRSDQKAAALKAFRTALRQDGSLFITHMLPFDREDLRSRFGFRVARTSVQRSRWVDSETQWWELVHEVR